MRKELFPTIALLFILLAPTITCVGQPETQDIRAKEKELEKLRREIDGYEEKIKKSERRERATLETLDNYDRQSILLRRLLRNLKEESNRLQKEIEEMKRGITRSENQLESLKSHYARYVISVYKHGRLHDLELLLTSTSMNQLAIRAEYLRRFTEQRRKDLGSIAAKKTSLEQEERTLNTKLKQRERLISQKAVEEKRIKRKSAERQQLLASIRKDKENYKKDLQRKTRAAAELEKIIADLVEKERIRKEREEELARREGRALPESVTPGLAFSSRRGKLPWPVSTGTVVAQFGNQTHPQLKTVTQNTGIDISTPAGTEVRTVADGEVALISWIISYGNLVIVNHTNGFRTVYAHLSEITVTQGQKVREGEVVGKSGDSLSGPLLHFELWKDREKQDPEAWLRKR
jgi:septal ring factor EnvC (AmiA/AmiB activator)